MTMDDSQSSDVFPEINSDFCDISPENIDTGCHNTLYEKVKNDLHSCLRNKKITNTSFSTILTDCQNCITQGLEIVVSILGDFNFKVGKVCGYLECTVTLLQMLSEVIKTAIESVVMYCHNLRSFPATTGNIILTIFMHCKDSECIYGDHLKFVEKQLKDLFRSCHELQLTYLMTLEKHFLFDLAEREQQDVLIEALNINMKIGEIVQALDIKAMAEQWKAFTVICEKYSNFLLENKSIYYKSIQLFATIVKDNIKIAIEADEEDKNIIRSLKVANFTIKLLLRIWNVFKNANAYNYDNVIELLLYIYLHNTAYLEALEQKPEQFLHLLHTNIAQPTDRLLLELAASECFIDNIYKIKVQKLDSNSLLGYIVLITSLIRAIMHQAPHEAKIKIISCIFKILPYGHMWFNMRLKFSAKMNKDDSKSYSLFEHLLSHTVAFSRTFNSDQYAALERQMYEAVLSTDCYSALFSSNLWTLLVRSNSNDRLTLNTLLSLSNVYQRLETHKLFHKSPQKVHISYTICKLFEMLPTADKGLIYKQFNVEHDDNVGLWSSLGVCHLPEDSRKNAEDFVFDKLKKTYENCFGSTITENGLADLTKVTRLAATCSFVGHDNALEKYLIQAWDKTSLNKVVSSKDNCVTKTELNGLEYLESLVSLTKSVKCELWNYSNIEQITCSISSILHLSNTEETILMFELFCFLTVKGRRDQNKHIIDTIYSDTLKSLIQRAEPFLRYNIFRNMANHDYCKQEYKVIFKGIDDNGLLDKEWRIYCNLINKPNSIEWKQKLLQVENNTFRHKCIKTSFHKLIKEGSMQSTQSNFDLGDTLFGDDSDSDEPLSKKVKLDQSEMSNLIARMENDTSLLCKLKGTLLSEEHKKRITNMYDKLKNIVS